MKRNYMRSMAFLVILLCFVGMAVFMKHQDQENHTSGGMNFRIEDDAVALSNDDVFQEEVPQEGIQIPGYANLIFSAEDTNQNMLLYNPEGNTCYFQYHLKLDDESIFDSDYIEPGKGLEKITLSRALQTGEYQLEIKVDTFSIESGEPMNNAVVYADLKVL